MNANEKLKNSIKKELESVVRMEMKLDEKANVPENSYKKIMESKIPPKVNSTLQTSFAKAFEIIFEHGVKIIEKGYNENELNANFDIQNYAIERKGSRKELKKLRQSAGRSDFFNMSVTTVEGIGLGLLGIGLPDIVVFIGMLLKGIYEASLRYGYDYRTAQEKFFILTMIKAALSKGVDRDFYNAQADAMFFTVVQVDESMLKREIKSTSDVMAMDMLILKFIQGLPVVGAVGGAFNPVYYGKILKYVRLKYYKRYLLDKLKGIK